MHETGKNIAQKIYTIVYAFLIAIYDPAYPFYCLFRCWTLKNNIVVPNTAHQKFVVIPESKAISNYAIGNTAVTAGALGYLLRKVPFRQIRFHYSKKIPGQTFHVASKMNGQGEDVVKFFTAQTDEFPKSCGS